MKKIILSLSILAMALSAEAGRNQNREHRQEKRIGQGVQSGELTKREARRLERGQNKIDHFQKKAMEDGEMSLEEKAKLEKMQDRQSRKIHRQKHDEQSRPEAAEGNSAVAPADSQ